MSFNHNVTPAAWNELSLDMPFSTPCASSEDEAFNTPGCCLKSNERADGGWPAYFGRLLSNKDLWPTGLPHPEGHTVIVLAMVRYPNDPLWVWTGSKAEYYSVWRCD